jgi:hypothetical protein
VIYLDTGCFVKLYYPEPDSSKVIVVGGGRIRQYGRTAEEAGSGDGTEPGADLRFLPGVGRWRCQVQGLFNRTTKSLQRAFGFSRQKPRV